MKPSPNSLPETDSRCGFTLIELCVVLATCALLGVELLPALAGTHQNSQAFQCLNNQRQIVLAWQMYAADNSDVLPPNDWFSGNGQPVAYMKGLPFSWNCIAGEMDQISINNQATNTDLLINPNFTALAIYNHNAATYHCPADNSVVTGVGPRVRSVSMNAAVGSVWNHPNPAGGIVSGGPLPANFLDGSGWTGASLSKYWRTYNKLTGMIHPAPAKLFVITDENPFSINDLGFTVSMGVPEANGQATSTQIIDTPASYHDGAVTLSFADGHTEFHRWLGSTIKITQAISAYNAGDSLQDLQWLQARTTAAK